MRKFKNLKINKKSIDARDKNNILYVYEVDVEVPNENNILAQNKNPNILKTPNEKYIYPKLGSLKLTSKIIIVGSGPAGLFAGLMLAKKGYKPLIIERGEKAPDMVHLIDRISVDQEKISIRIATSDIQT